MNFKLSNILMPLVIGAVVVSCEQKELDQISPEPNAQITANAVSSNLLYNETFEGSTAFDGLHLQFGTTHAFKQATSPVFEGAKSGRFELRDSDPETSSGTRAEVLFPDQTHRERWYSFRAYYPSSGYKTDSNNDILNQWHQGSGSGSPSATLRVKNDRFFMRIGNTSDNRKDYDLGVVQTKDQWHEFVLHFVHSNGSDGLVEVWHNGTKVLTHTGGNMYDLKLPRWKVGIYKDDWNGSETTDSNLRIFYLDNVRMGNENATYADMTSGSATTAPAPTEPAPTAPAPTEPIAPAPTTSTTTQGVTGFVLVDAATEKDVLTITNGSTISLSSLVNTKLNVRAVTNPTTVGSVKFALSGAQSKSYTDNAAPYALHGDNGSGNYYYGNWNPPATGTYTLTATPYSGANGSGTAGTPVTITFTITASGTTSTAPAPAPAPTEPIAPAPTTSTTTQGVTGFVLVDAATEKDVLTITNGSTISLSSLANKKLNIRAVTNSTTVGSVKFALSGAQSKSYTDNAAPFALHGDSGSGNYYYGNWNPPAAGTYTLTATPYSNDNGSGTAGTPITVTFTIKN